MNARSVVTVMVAAVTIAGCRGGGRAERSPATQPAQPSSRILASGDWQEAARYADPVVLSQLRERAIDVLEAAARGSDAQVRANALEALAAAPARLSPLIAPALSDNNVGVRSVAAVMVGRLKLAEFAPACRPLTGDPSPFVRASAIFALARLDPSADQTPLADALFNSARASARAHAAYLIGEIGNPSALGMLKHAATQRVPNASPAQMQLLQLQIAEAMIKLGATEQYEVIRAALYPASPSELEATALAVQILGQLGDTRAVNELIYLTAKPGGQRMPAEIELGAAGALARLGLRKGSFIADEYWNSPMPTIRAQAASVYGEIGLLESLPRVETLMQDESPLVRVAASAAALQIAEANRGSGGTGFDGSARAFGSE